MGIRDEQECGCESGCKLNGLIFQLEACDGMMVGKVKMGWRIDGERELGAWRGKSLL